MSHAAGNGGDAGASRSRSRRFPPRSLCAGSPAGVLAEEDTLCRGVAMAVLGARTDVTVRQIVHVSPFRSRYRPGTPLRPSTERMILVPRRRPWRVLLRGGRLERRKCSGSIDPVPPTWRPTDDVDGLRCHRTGPPCPQDGPGGAKPNLPGLVDGARRPSHESLPFPHAEELLREHGLLPTSPSRPWPTTNSPPKR